MSPSTTPTAFLYASPDDAVLEASMADRFQFATSQGTDFSSPGYFSSIEPGTATYVQAPNVNFDGYRHTIVTNEDRSIGVMINGQGYLLYSTNLANDVTTQTWTALVALGFDNAQDLRRIRWHSDVGFYAVHNGTLKHAQDGFSFASKTLPAGLASPMQCPVVYHDGNYYLFEHAISGVYHKSPSNNNSAPWTAHSYAVPENPNNLNAPADACWSDELKLIFVACKGASAGPQFFTMDQTDKVTLRTERKPGAADNASPRSLKYSRLDLAITGVYQNPAVIYEFDGVKINFFTPPVSSDLYSLVSGENYFVLGHNGSLQWTTSLRSAWTQRLGSYHYYDSISLGPFPSKLRSRPQFSVPMARMDAMIAEPLSINAGFSAPKFDSQALLAINETFAYDVEQNTGDLFLLANNVTYEDIDVNSVQMLAAFRAPFARFNALLTDRPAILADFIVPFQRFDAVLEVESPSKINASFVIPFAKFDAELEVEVPSEITAAFIVPFAKFDAELEVETPRDAEIDFVAPFAQFSASLLHFSINASFSVPMPGMQAVLLSTDGLYAQFNAPMPSMSAELENTIEIEAEFNAPFGGWDASLGEEFVVINNEFVAPFGQFDALLDLPEVILASFVAPFQSFDATLEKLEQINAEFVVPFQRFDAEIIRGLTMDGRFRAPFPRMDAELFLGDTPDAVVSYGMKKYSVDIRLKQSNGSSLTFLLIQP